MQMFIKRGSKSFKSFESLERTVPGDPLPELLPRAEVGS